MQLKNYTLFAAGTAALLILAGCDRSDRPIGRFMPLDGEPVATVNGVTLYESELESLMQMRQRSGQPLPREQVIEELIGIELLRQQAVADGVHKDPDIKLQINQNATNALISAQIGQLMESQPVSDEEIQAEYEKQVGAEAGTEYKSRHILSETREQAEENIKALEGGADFAELAKEKSTGPSAGRGGALGWAKPDSFVGEFSTALKGLEPGKYTHDPVQTQYGWHVILLEETREAAKPPMDRMRNQLQRQLTSERIENYLAGLKEKANIEKHTETSGDTGDTAGQAPADSAQGSKSESSKSTESSGEKPAAQE